MMPITARIETKWNMPQQAAGTRGSANRRKPYDPIFSRTPASSTLPAVGASTCAKGSQVWKGNRGTLMAKPANSARKIHGLTAVQYLAASGFNCTTCEIPSVKVGIENVNGRPGDIHQYDKTIASRPRNVSTL